MSVFAPKPLLIRVITSRARYRNVLRAIDVYRSGLVSSLSVGGSRVARVDRGGMAPELAAFLDTAFPKGAYVSQNAYVPARA
jgi:hypothetical protein